MNALIYFNHVTANKTFLTAYQLSPVSCTGEKKGLGTSGIARNLFEIEDYTGSLTFSNIFLKCSNDNEIIFIVSILFISLIRFFSKQNVQYTYTVSW